MKTIVVHDGQFHADEVCAFTILQKIFGELILIRARDEISINLGNFVVDVGFMYEPNSDKFDHHQHDFNEKFPNSNIPMASAGLVYTKYGKTFLKTYINDNDIVETIYNKFYHKFIKEIDAIDNGVMLEYNKDYNIMGISTLISYMNNNDIYDYDKQMEKFMEASKLMLQHMDIVINHLINEEKNFIHDYPIIEKACNERFNHSETGEFIIIDTDCNQWLRCILQYEKKHNCINNIKFVIYPSNEQIRIRAIKIGSILRKPLLNQNILRSNIKNTDDLLFIHKNLFIGSFKTKETAIEVAKLSLGIY